jgi:hypothetical protein
VIGYLRAGIGIVHLTARVEVNSILLLLDGAAKNIWCFRLNQEDAFAELVQHLMPMLGLPLDDHKVLKLNAVQCFLGANNDADDKED